jgi:hypothetical protein
VTTPSRRKQPTHHDPVTVVEEAIAGDGKVKRTASSPEEVREVLEEFEESESSSGSSSSSNPVQSVLEVVGH